MDERPENFFTRYGGLRQRTNSNESVNGSALDSSEAVGSVQQRIEQVALSGIPRPKRTNSNESVAGSYSSSEKAEKDVDKRPQNFTIHTLYPVSRPKRTDSNESVAGSYLSREKAGSIVHEDPKDQNLSTKPWERPWESRWDPVGPYLVPSEEETQLHLPEHSRWDPVRPHTDPSQEVTKSVPPISSYEYARQKYFERMRVVERFVAADVLERRVEEIQKKSIELDLSGKGPMPDFVDWPDYQKWAEGPGKASPAVVDEAVKIYKAGGGPAAMERMTAKHAKHPAPEYRRALHTAEGCGSMCNAQLDLHPTGLKSPASERFVERTVAAEHGGPPTHGHRRVWHSSEGCGTACSAELNLHPSGAYTSGTQLLSSAQNPGAAAEYPTTERSRFSPLTPTIPAQRQSQITLGKRPALSLAPALQPVDFLIPEPLRSYPQDGGEYAYHSGPKTWFRWRIQSPRPIPLSSMPPYPRDGNDWAYDSVVNKWCRWTSDGNRFYAEMPEQHTNPPQAPRPKIEEVHTVENSKYSYEGRIERAAKSSSVPADQPSLMDVVVKKATSVLDIVGRNGTKPETTRNLQEAKPIIQEPSRSTVPENRAAHEQNKQRLLDKRMKAMRRILKVLREFQDVRKQNDEESRSKARLLHGEGQLLVLQINSMTARLAELDGKAPWRSSYNFEKLVAEGCLSDYGKELGCRQPSTESSGNVEQAGSSSKSDVALEEASDCEIGIDGSSSKSVTVPKRQTDGEVPAEQVLRSKLSKKNVDDIDTELQYQNTLDRSSVVADCGCDHDEDERKDSRETSGSSVVADCGCDHDEDEGKDSRETTSESSRTAQNGSIDNDFEDIDLGMPDYVDDFAVVKEDDWRLDDKLDDEWEDLGN